MRPGVAATWLPLASRSRQRLAGIKPPLGTSVPRWRLARRWARTGGISGKARVMGTVSRRRRRLLALGEIVLLLWLSARPGWAGFEEGVRAYQSGDYPTAVRALLPLA